MAPERQKDTRELVKIMKEVSGFPAKMWGPASIGFGSYHYKYASGHEGDMCIIGFSPRKAAFSLYVFSPTPESKKILKDLGKFKMSKACIYVNKVADINVPVLQKLCKESIKYIEEHHECGCRE